MEKASIMAPAGSHLISGHGYARLGYLADIIKFIKIHGPNFPLAFHRTPCTASSVGIDDTY